MNICKTTPVAVTSFSIVCRARMAAVLNNGRTYYTGVLIRLSCVYANMITWYVLLNKNNGTASITAGFVHV